MFTLVNTAGLMLTAKDVSLAQQFGLWAAIATASAMLLALWEGSVVSFKYAAITLVGNNAPIILGIEPVKSDLPWEEDDSASYPLRNIVDWLLTKAEEFVDLDVVLFDREFYSHPAFDVVDQKGLTYFTPKKKYARDYDNIESIEEHPSADVAVQHDMPSHYDKRSHGVEMLYVPSHEEDGEYAVFVTNMSHVKPSEI